MRGKNRGTFFLLAGFIIFAAPFLLNCGFRIWSGGAKRAFEAANSEILWEENAAGESEYGKALQEESAVGKIESTVEKAAGYRVIQGTEKLFTQIAEYNAYLSEEGQANIMDTQSVIQTPSGIDGLENGMFGYVTIPAMDVELPLYIGASDSNLAKGAAVLGATSLPVGGNNTNSVIAGHRGYRGIPYFREIEKLSVGDSVFVTNPWETLAYRVEAIDIVDPYDNDAIRIREGKDMVTLLTYHPYRSHGTYRYVVYCVREESRESQDAAAAADVGSDAIFSSDGEEYECSAYDIALEKVLRAVCGAFFVLIFLVYSVRKNQK
ncbi:MAG: class C sortase [Lachnospiraceae bacterium]|nr:class C sortase [Lachnospiraceae bacterium]